MFVIPMPISTSRELRHRTRQCSRGLLQPMVASAAAAVVSGREASVAVPEGIALATC
jgi:hypothetical protein